MKNITRLLIKAREKEDRNDAWDLYVSKYPSMTEENYVSFDEVYKPGQKIKDKEKSEEEILADVKRILDAFNESR